ncbi:creatininase family protein [Membranihabitans maritimus]|uniref:creatininase family protein n=1 Tax=Membranihabitans maritimus TaxID=2904244 RepID=UPI001F3584A1|nr:creatininase family protein [Membranihabitans maritimus]
MSNNIRPFVLKETNWKSVKKEDYQIAILPWGATEAHNFHLPYGTDTYLAEEVAILSAEKAWGKGVKAVVLPPVPFGVNTGQIDIPLCLNMNPSTQLALLKDLLLVIKKSGIQKLVIFNAHGGNHFKQMIREVYLEFPDIFVCALNWWQVQPAEKFFKEPGDHAGELETSAIMYLFPELVLPLEQAGDGKSFPFNLKAIQEGWVSTQRVWSKATRDTGVGNPQFSTSENGRRFIEEVSGSVAEFFEELGGLSLEDLYSDSQAEQN